MALIDSVIGSLERYAANSFGAVGTLFTAEGSFLSPVPILFAVTIAGYIVFLRLRASPAGFSLGQFRRTLFPSAVYKHKSAQRDFWIILINEGLLFFVPAIAVVAVSYFRVGAIAVTGAGPEFTQQPRSDLVTLFMFGVFFTLVWDFFATFSHYLKHKIPVLWEFHKVHHCAEVLTPLTAMRRHPMEILIGGIIVGTGIASALILWVLLFGAPAKNYEIGGQAAAIYLWRLLGYNIRHSHIWISYGPFWNKVFISPAHHQLHHSRETRHHDCNFGHIFSFWDAMFGTLYHPQKNEEFELGIEKEENAKLQTLKELYWRPMTMAARHLMPKPSESSLAKAD